MKIERAEKSELRKILIAMIVDTTVLSRVASKWERHGLFADDWPNLIGGWAVKFFDKYGKAPGKAIESYFSEWASTNENEALVKLVEKFMASLSGEYKRMKKEINSKYVIDQAIKYFNRVRLEKLRDEIERGLDTGKTDEVYKKAMSFGKLEMGVQAMVRPFEDKSVVTAAFAERRDPLFRYEGKSLEALNNFFEATFERDAFVAFMGPEKRGKTWWLIDTAYRAMLQGRRVAFFEVGDMSQNQIERRLMVRASGRPWEPKIVKIPKYIDIDTGDVDVEVRKFRHRLKRSVAWEACKRVVEKAGSDLWRLWVFPNSTLSIAGVQAELRTVEQQEWIPDLIVIDYADLLDPLPGYAKDSQDQIDATWKAMRSLSQQYHCCVVTATQSDAASYYVETLDKSHFSRDKRKFAHVTAMIGINQKKEEKRVGLFRLNQLVVRESEYEEDKCVHVAGCLALANPAIKATF
jgi:hypothetical protein